ncbi:MAG: hypothetical protein LBB18_04375 [Puniceicoccales bacterium]|nr:hypothetical protein [Puniceicoccales bacterium]
MPNSEKWGKFIEQFDDDEKIELIRNFNKILQAILTLTAISNYLITDNLDVGCGVINEVQVERICDFENEVPRYELSPLVNAIAKMRITSFEFMKSHSLFSDCFTQKQVLDNSWFSTFCASNVGFHNDKSVFEEQKSIMGYCKATDIPAEQDRKLFASLKNAHKPVSRFGTNVDPTVKLCNFLLVKVEQLRDIITSEEILGNDSSNDKNDKIKKTIEGNPGLLMCGNIYKRPNSHGSSPNVVKINLERVISKFDNQVLPNDSSSINALKFTLFLKDFRDMMYLHACTMEVNDDCVKVFKGSARNFEIYDSNTDTQNDTGNGFTLKSENESRICTNRELDTDRNVLNLIGEELSQPKTQTLGLLQFLGNHLEICSCIYESNETKNNQNFAQLNVLLQSLTRKIFLDADGANGDVHFAASPKFTLQEDAADRAEELLVAARTLWNKGKSTFFGKSITGRPQISQICALMHVIHLVHEAVIQNNQEKNVHVQVEDFIAKLTEDINRMYQTSDISNDEKMLLRIAKNECIHDLIGIRMRANEEVDDCYLVSLYENIFFLQNFDSRMLPKGYSEIMRKTATDYISVHDDQAARIASKLHSKITLIDVNPATGQGKLQFKKKGIFQFGDENNNFVDLCTLRIYLGGELVNCDRTFLSHMDNGAITRIFPQKNSIPDAISVGNNLMFSDVAYGDVIITKESDLSTTIFRRFPGTERYYKYISPGNVKNLLPLGCFWFDDFTVWQGDGQNNFKICSAKNPNEVLYESLHNNCLSDIRKQKADEPYLIPIAKLGGGIFSRFELNEFVVPYCDNEGKLVEITMPRYACANGEPLRFKSQNNKWVLASNPAYEVVNAPLLPLSDGTIIERNPLLGDSNVVWLRKTDAKGNNEYKCLIPDLEFFREHGLSHEVKSGEHVDFYNNEKYGTYNRLGCLIPAEASVCSNETDSTAPLITSGNTIGYLRLAHIFQAQGEYSMAIQMLEACPSKGKLSKEEVRMFHRIFDWSSRGCESSGPSAIVVLKAISRMLQMSPLGEHTHIISHNEEQFHEILMVYLLSFDTYSVQMQFNPREERNLLENIKMITQSNFIHMAVDARINDLNKIIELGEENFFNAAKEDKKNHSQEYALYRKDIGLQNFHAKYDGVSNDIEREGPTVENGLRTALDEINIQILAQPIMGNAVTTTIDADVHGNEIRRLPLTDEEKKKFGSVEEQFYKEFMAEFRNGEKQLKSLADEAISMEIPSVERILKLKETVDAQRETATKNAKDAISSMQLIANKDRANITYDANVWEKVVVPKIMGAYGMFVSSGANGRERAVALLRNNYPWLDADKKIEELFKNTEKYLVNITSMRYLAGISDALVPLSNASREKTMRQGDWQDALTLLRKVRPIDFANSDNTKLSGNILLFEYMTGIRPRSDQVTKMDFILKSISQPSTDNRGILIQQIMGSGKTKVLIPFLILSLFNMGEKLPIVLSHSSQLPAVALELPHILSMVGIRLDVVEMDYAKFLDVKEVRALREKLMIAKDKRNTTVAISSNMLLAARTAFRSLFTNGSNIDQQHAHLIEELTNLLDFLKSSVIPIMDEAHVTLDPKESFVVDSKGNSEQSIPADDVAFIGDVVFSLPEQLTNAIKQNTNDQILPQKLRSILIEHTMGKYCKQFRVPESLKENFAKFLCGMFDGDTEPGQKNANVISSVQSFIDKMAPGALHNVVLLRKLFSNVIFTCFKRTYGVQCGYNADGEIVPYRNGAPTGSRYQDPHQILIQYFMANITKGIHPKSIETFVIGIVRSAEAETRTNSGLAIDDTSKAKFFSGLFGGTMALSSVIDINKATNEIIVRPEMLDEMIKFLENPKNSKNKTVVVSEIAQLHAHYTAATYDSTPPGIANMFTETICMSGTLDNKDAYPASVSTAIDRQNGELGKIVAKLMADEASQKTQIVQGGELILKTVGGALGKLKNAVKRDKITNLRLVADYGALFKDQPPREAVVDIVNFIKENGISVTHIEYFDPRLNGFAIVSIDDISTNGENFTPRKITDPLHDRPMDKNKLFTYLDSPHTTGTDVQMMSNGHGMTTLNLFLNNVGGLLQSVMRERNFLSQNGQTMDIVTSEEAVESIFPK